MTDRVLITGATGGLGVALAETFANQHADLALHYRSQSAAAEALAFELEKVGARAVAIQQDFAVDDLDAALAHFMAHVHNEVGVPNVVVLNASAQDVVGWDDLTTADWDHLYRNSLRHTAALLHLAARDMRKLDHHNRVIVIVGSIEGLRPAASHAPYSVMKAAEHHLVAAAAHELGIHGIRVVGVAPGLIEADGLAERWPDGYGRFATVSALHRPVTPLEVAQTVAFLASPAASGITGVTLPVDAGWSAHPGW